MNKNETASYLSSFSDNISVIGNQIQFSFSEESTIKKEDVQSYSIKFSEEELKE
jgi:hypothetical protein